MNSRTTLFLLILVALVGGFVVWDHYKGKSTDELQAKGKRILDFEAKDITGIDLVRSNQTIVLAKSGDSWELKQPLAVRADFSAVSSILDELEFAERTRTLTEAELKGVNISELGLDAPRYRITLHSAKRPVGLIVGRETPTKDALYVQVEGRKEVYVTRKSIEERLKLKLDELRNRNAIEFTPATTTRLEIKTADRVIELSKSTGEQRWTLNRPLVARADQEKVSELLTDLNGLRIQDFISEDPKDVHTYLLDEPEREITVMTGDSGKTLVVSKPLTNEASKVYAKLKSGNSIFTVSADVAKKFAAQINDLRDTRILTFNQPDVKGIEIVRGTDKIALNHTGQGWQLSAPIKISADDPSVTHFLENLGNLRATQFEADVATDLDKYGLATPAITVSLLADGTNVLTQLLIGGAGSINSARYAKTSDEPFIYSVAPSTVDQIPSNHGPFRSRRVFDLKPEQVTKLEAGDVTLTRDPQGKWQLVAPTQGVLDADGVQHVVEVFSQLRAEDFGRAKTDQDSGLGTTIRATIGDTTHWLSIAKDGQAAADACELTFRLVPAVIQTLSKPLVATPVRTNAVSSKP